MKLKSKILLSFLVIVLFAGMSQLFSLQGLIEAEKKINQKLIPSVDKLGHVKQVAILMQWLQYDFQSMYLDLWGYVYSDQSFWKKKYSKREMGVQKITQQLRAVALKDDEPILRQIEFIGGELLKEYRAILFDYENGDKEKSFERLKNLKIVRLNEAIQAQFAEYFEIQGIDLDKMLTESWASYADRELKHVALESKNIINRHILYLIAGIFLLTLVSLALSFFMAKTIVRNIEILGVYLERMRRGNWAIKIPHFSNDEIGELAQSFNALSSVLNSISDSRQELVRKFEKHRQTQRLLETNRKELEEQKQAAFNLMEDAEEARLVAEQAANDIKKTASALANSNKELRESAQLLKAQQRKLVQAEKLSALGTMAAGVAHELNNPLMGILNYIQYSLKKIPPSEKIHQVLLDAEKETKRCSKIISDILTFSRVRSQSAFSEMKTSSVANLLDQTLKVLALRIKEVDIKVIRESSFDEIKLKMDESEIQQVMTNLIANAIDALEGCKQREIHIAAVQKTATVEMIIRDTGSGMSQETLSKIFDPFYTTKPTGKGTGLGLSICSTIMSEHGGELLCESTLGQGTSFHLIFPKALLA